MHSIKSEHTDCHITDMQDVPSLGELHWQPNCAPEDKSDLAYLHVHSLVADRALLK